MGFPNAKKGQGRGALLRFTVAWASAGTAQRCASLGRTGVLGCKTSVLELGHFLGKLKRLVGHSTTCDLGQVTSPLSTRHCLQMGRLCPWHM